MAPYEWIPCCLLSFLCTAGTLLVIAFSLSGFTLSPLFLLQKMHFFTGQMCRNHGAKWMNFLLFAVLVFALHPSGGLACHSFYTLGASLASKNFSAPETELAARVRKCTKFAQDSSWQNDNRIVTTIPTALRWNTFSGFDPLWHDFKSWECQHPHWVKQYKWHHTESDSLQNVLLWG